MRVVSLSDAEAFESPGHSGVAPRWVQGGPGTPVERFTVVLSRYDPGGRAEPTVQPAETVYVILSGRLTFESGGDRVLAGPEDTVHFAKGEARSVTNEGDVPAGMLVIRATS
ncbi:cupin domain-containing protein [Pseudonocardia yuanmonensis]|uniref:Cupin domain-containing protein n=1 Tax=Pseudonocardia yuanmonensis TaxID=1095914 RepID=A0ABP8X733_9PSEU